LFLIAAFTATGANGAELSDLNTGKAALEELAPSAALPIPAAADNYDFSGPEKAAGDRWYGADSRQARMRFNSYMYYELPEDYDGDVSDLLSDPYHSERIRELVDLQLQHMYGAFTTHPGFVDNPGIPSGDYKMTLLGSEKAPEENYARIDYSYDDIVVFSSNLFSGGSSRIQFVLPRDPANVYKKGIPSGGRKNRCTDEHYDSEGDFWYFWNPYQDGCPLDGGDLVAVQTDLKPIPMTRDTYPDYSRLGRGGELKVVYLVGVDEGFQSGDLGRMTFNNAFEYLTEAGFEAGVNQARKKNLYFNNGRQNVSVEMLLLNPDSPGFAVEAVRGMKTADIFIYDGHSGLGGYLNPERLAAYSGSALTLPREKYQIFVFQGCSTYAYYNSAFFRLKKTGSDPKGTKNLDIITTGIGAAFDVGAAVDSTFIRSVAMGDRPSWQTIMRRISKAEGENTALSHVNGDEDNPDSPN